MSAGRWRAVALTGPDADVALDFLHVHADVQGVLREPRGHVVWLTGGLPSFPAAMAIEVEERVVADEDFTITGLECDDAILVAEDLLVRPPWVDRPAGFDGVELVVPRGGAFGSGEHASTQAALLLLHQTWSRPASLADVGCGSGILALYAQVRGVARIAACDVDRPSVDAARELLPGAHVTVGTPDQLPPCSQVVANMTGAELGSSLDAILRLWQGAAPLVLSGMLAHEVDGISQSVGRPELARVSVDRFTAVAFAASAGERGGPQLQR